MAFKRILKKKERVVGLGPRFPSSPPPLVPYPWSALLKKNNKRRKEESPSSHGN